MAKVEMDQSRRSYIVTEDTSAEMFSYTVKKVNFQTIGTLTLMSVTLPAGRVLRETGRKLAPGINPGVSTYMVSVYDNQQMITGFIDPNAPVFAVYNNDRPNFLVDNVDPGLGPVQTSGNNAAFAYLTDRGAPVYTNGRVLASTTVTAGLSLAAGTFVSTGTYAHIGSYLTAQTGISTVTGNVTAVAGNLVAPLGKLVVNAGANGCVGNAALPGGGNSSGTGVTVLTSAFIPATSKVFLTYTGINNAGSLTYTSAAGGFTIKSTNVNDQGSVNWLIVN